MSTSPGQAESVTPASKPGEAGKDLRAVRHRSSWQKYVTPVLAIFLALAILITLTRSWNSWEGGHLEQATDDAYVRGDLTPLSTKVAGIVRSVTVSDYQQVHKGDLLVELEDNDFQAQVFQGTAAWMRQRLPSRTIFANVSFKTLALIRRWPESIRLKLELRQRKPARTLLKLN